MYIKIKSLIYREAYCTFTILYFLHSQLRTTLLDWAYRSIFLRRMWRVSVVGIRILRSQLGRMARIRTSLAWTSKILFIWFVKFLYIIIVINVYSQHHWAHSNCEGISSSSDVYIWFVFLRVLRLYKKNSKSINQLIDLSKI